MTQPLTTTLAHVARDSWRTTRRIADAHTTDRGTPRAIFNRLQKLRALKLVQKRRAGREKLWRLV